MFLLSGASNATSRRGSLSVDVVLLLLSRQINRSLGALRLLGICCVFLLSVHLFRLEPRAAALGQFHTVFDVVVMSSMLDYYFSCLYHCIAAEYIIHSDSMLSLVRNDIY